MFNVSTFPCPSCHEFISTNTTSCKYCSVPIDPQMASIAAELQDRVNKACNEASLVRNSAGTMWVSFFLRFIPFIGFIAGIAMVVLIVLIPIQLIRWQVSFGGIQTADPDYKRAKQKIPVALGLWLLMIIVLAVLMFLAGPF